MVLAVLGCEDMNQGTQGENGNEPENEGTETLELPTLWGVGEDSKPILDKDNIEVSEFELISFHISEDEL